MPEKLHLVKLSAAQRETLQTMLKGGMAKARELTRARILLKADEGWSDAEIATALDTSVKTCERVRQRYATHGLEAALKHHEPHRRKQPILDGVAEARLIAVACSAPPQGCAHWTMELLAGELVRLQVVASVSDETVRRTLKKNPDQALADRGVVPAQGARRGVRLSDGRRFGSLPATLRPAASRGGHG